MGESNENHGNGDFFPAVFFFVHRLVSEKEGSSEPNLAQKSSVKAPFAVKNVKMGRKQ